MLKAICPCGVEFEYSLMDVFTHWEFPYVLCPFCGDVIIVEGDINEIYYKQLKAVQEEQNMNIMEMPDGTIIKNKKSEICYKLGDWANEDAREILSLAGMCDYISRFTQHEYEVCVEESNA